MLWVLTRGYAIVTKYLVPSNYTAVIPDETSAPEYMAYSRQKHLLESDDEKCSGLRNRAESFLNLANEVKSMTLEVGNLFPIDEAKIAAIPAGTNTSYSLFDGLRGVAKDVACNVPLISVEGEIIASEEKREEYVRQNQHHQRKEGPEQQQHAHEKHLHQQHIQQQALQIATYVPVHGDEAQRTRIVPVAPKEGVMNTQAQPGPIHNLGPPASNGSIPTLHNTAQTQPSGPQGHTIQQTQISYNNLPIQQAHATFSDVGSFNPSGSPQHAITTHNTPNILQKEAYFANGSHQGSESTSVHSSTSIQTAAASTSPLMTTNSNKRDNPPTMNQGEPKKRKPDTSLEHLEIEKLALKQLLFLIERKIFLADEDAEYESSDIWQELENSKNILNDSVITEIHGYITKIVPTSLKTDIPLRILERIQELCMKSIRAANEVNWVDGEHYIKLAGNALKSVSLLFAVLNMQREEKQLYLDDYILEPLTFVYTFTEDFILKSISQGMISDVIIQLNSSISKVLTQLNDQLEMNSQNDTLITKLEYLCITMIFQKCDRLLLSLKSSALTILNTIFKIRRDQRSFIIDELLLNFDKLPTHKVSSRDINLGEGVHIQFITKVIMQLIEVFTVTECYGNETTITKSELTDEEISRRRPEDQRFARYVKDVRDEKIQFCTTVASTLVSKLISSTSFKSILELFITDLLNIVTRPTFTGAEALLCRFLEILVSNTEGQSAVVETSLLEILGMIGTAMLEIRGACDLPSKSMGDLKEQYTMVANFLQRKKNNHQMQTTSNVFMSEWIIKLMESLNFFEKDLGEDQSDDYLTLMGIIGYNNGGSNDSIGIQHKEVTAIVATEEYKKILQQSKFVSLYQNFLNHLLKAVDHPKIKSRTRALKNLSMLIERDPRVIYIPSVKQTLSNRIKDPSSLVRLAVLDIFDQYILQKPELIGDFYKSLILTADKSTAVRNRSIKIARRIFNDSSDTASKVFLLQKILRRIDDDEESVVESAKGTLMDILFLGPSYKSNQSESKLKDECMKLMLVIGKLVEKSTSDWYLFEKFLFEDIIQVNDENKRFHTDLLQVCQVMTMCLVSYTVDNVDTEKQNNVDTCLGLLSIFTKSDVPFISQDQLMSLLPYITADTTATAATSYYSWVILRNSLNHLSSLRESFLKSAQTSVLKRLTKLNTRELEVAMPAVWSLSVMLNDTVKIANAACSCLSLVLPFVDLVLENMLIDVDHKLIRLLYLLGAFGKYCDLEKYRDIFVKHRLGIKPKETVFSLITKVIMIFTKSNVNRDIRKAALRNLIHCATTHSKLFLNDRVLNVMDTELLQNDDVPLKSFILQGVLEFLEKEESDSLKENTNTAKEKPEKSSLMADNQRINNNEDICASLANRYLQTAMSLCTSGSSDADVFTGVKFLKYVVRMGYGSPMACIGPVINLQLSTNPYIRTVGQGLHRELHEKYEPLVENTYAHNLFGAFKISYSTSKEHCLDESMIIHKFYKIFEESKGAKRKFLKQLPKTVDLKRFQDCEQMQLMEYYVAFLSKNLLECKFTMNEDVYTLIHEFELVVQYNALILKTEMDRMADIKDQQQVDALGYYASSILILNDFVNTLRRNYRLNQKNINPDELSSTKVKTISDQASINVSLYCSGDGANSIVFQRAKEQVFLLM